MSCHWARDFEAEAWRIATAAEAVSARVELVTRKEWSIEPQPVFELFHEYLADLEYFFPDRMYKRCKGCAELGVTFRIPDSGSACRISRNSGVPAARSGRCERWLLQGFRSRPPARECDAHVRMRMRMRRATRPSAPPMAARDSEERDGAEWPRRHRRWNVQPLLSCLFWGNTCNCDWTAIHARTCGVLGRAESRPRARKLMFREHWLPSPRYWYRHAISGHVCRAPVFVCVCWLKSRDVKLSVMHEFQPNNALNSR